METENFGQYSVPDAETCVALNVGQPSNDFLKHIKENVINKLLQKLIENPNPSLLQYGNIQGYTSFRNDFARFLSEQYKFSVNPNNLLMIDGITGALRLILPLLGCAGKTIFVEDPTYMNAITIFKELGMNVVSIPMSDDGIDIDNLQYEVSKRFHMGEDCYLYTIPYFNNPTGFSMKKCEQLKHICDAYPNLTILSDEVYHFLGFHSTSGYPLSYYHPNIISLGTFSKILCPSLRLGWIYASDIYIDKFSKSGTMDSAGGLTFSCCLVHPLFTSSDLTMQSIITEWRNFLHGNYKSLIYFLQHNLSEYIEDIHESDGGYFMWVGFKNHINMKELSKYMEKYQIKFHHGNKFTTTDKFTNYIRLSYSWYHDAKSYELFTLRLKNLIQDSLKIRIHILGHTGKLGKAICEEISKVPDLELVSGLGRDIDISLVTNFNNVIIDVSQPEATKNLLEKLLENKLYVPVLIGTTGALPFELIEKYSEFASILVCPNFSRGISEFKKMISQVDRDHWNTSMVEKHHVHKKDSPSGTAIALADVYGLPRDAITSIREGEIIGEHELILDSEYETISIKHVAKSRKLFALGALDHVREIVGLK